MPSAPPGTRQPALQATDVSKRYAGTRVLDGVSLGVAPGEIHALLGGNGSGKSTLIKILAGVVRADRGTIACGPVRVAANAMTPTLARRAGLRFVHQDPGLFPELTIAENLSIGHGFITGPMWRIRWRRLHEWAHTVDERFGIGADPRTLVRDLSPARRTMVAIARALQDQDDPGAASVLVLDEPTAALPDREVQLLHDALRRYAAAGQTIVYVSHRLDEVLAVADRVSVLRDGHLVATEPVAALDQHTVIQMILGRDVPATTIARAATTLPLDPVDPVIEWRGIVGGPLRGVDLAVAPGEIVGVAGLLGSGRTELLRSAFGAFAPDAGRVAIDGRPVRLDTPADAMNLDIAYVPENRHADAAFADLAVRINLSAAQVPRYWQGLRLRHRAERADAADSIAGYRIATDDDRRALATLSGGNQQKVVLARWLRRAPRVLLLDEPTQGVDVGARAEIHDLIREAAAKGSAVVMVSSDFGELAALADRVVALAGGRVTGELRRPDIDPRRLTEVVYAAVEVAP